MSKNKKQVVMVSVAELDADGLYQGVTYIAESELTDAHIQIPADCDLAIGGYAWDADNKTFVPTEAFIQQQIKNRRRM